MTTQCAAVCSTFAREARKLCGDGDNKLTRLLPRIQGLLKEGFKPIVFCRFIQTAEYVAAELRKRLRKAWRSLASPVSSRRTNAPSESKLSAPKPARRACSSAPTA